MSRFEIIVNLELLVILGQAGCWEMTQVLASLSSQQQVSLG